MTELAGWVAALATVGILVVYEVVLLSVQRRDPQRLARSVHAALREDWFVSVSAQHGSELLAVQTLRNSLMSATMTASTAVLGLMGTATLLAPTLGAAGTAPLTARLALELVLLTILFASLVCSAMAVRYYNHASFVCSMPVESEARQRWSGAGASYIRRAGILYGLGLRHLLMVAPILAGMAYPLAGPVTALVVVAALLGFDRVARAG